MSTLAERLVAHHKFPFNPGMVLSDGRFITELFEFAPGVNGEEVRADVCAVIGLDIEHPATKGVLLAMLREATGDEGVHVALMTPLGSVGGWAAYACYPLPSSACRTEGEALAAALLAVWGES